jgi:hypothetical protein
MHGIRRLAYAILDGTPIPINRLSGTQNRRYSAGKHRRHGGNAQVITDPHGRPMRISATPSPFPRFWNPPCHRGMPAGSHGASAVACAHRIWAGSLD